MNLTLAVANPIQIRNGNTQLSAKTGKPEIRKQTQKSPSSFGESDGPMTELWCEGSAMTFGKQAGAASRTGHAAITAPAVTNPSATPDAVTVSEPKQRRAASALWRVRLNLNEGSCCNCFVRFCAKRSRFLPPTRNLWPEIKRPPDTALVNPRRYASRKRSNNALGTASVRAGTLHAERSNKAHHPIRNLATADERRRRPDSRCVRMQSVLLQKSYSLDEFARLNDIALTTVRGEIKSGRLVARKIGRRTIITPEDANDWRNRLPKVQPRVRVASL